MALQSVFLASNRGDDVKQAPPEKVASKIYTNRRGGGGRWFGLRRVDPNRKSLKGMKNLFSRLCHSSVLTEVKVNGNENDPKPISPHHYLESLLLSRGYTCQPVQAKECAYFNKSSPLIEASYGTYMVEAVRSNRADILHALLDCGLSPNAANSHGDSIVHLACRLGLTDVLRELLEFGCRLQVSDEGGRTPLHEACWALEPNMEVVEMILNAEWEMLLVADTRGFVPLAYVRQENWPLFTRFLMRKKNTYWPDKLFVTPDQKRVPGLLTQKPNSQPIRCATSQLTVQMARLVSSGRMSPAEADMLVKDDKKWGDSDNDDSSSSDDENGEEEEQMTHYTGATDDDDSDDDDDDDSCFSFDEGEMAELLASIGTAGPVSW